MGFRINDDDVDLEETFTYYDINKHLKGHGPNIRTPSEDSLVYQKLEKKPQEPRDTFLIQLS